MKKTLKKKINKPPFFADSMAIPPCEGYWDTFTPTKPFNIKQIKKFKKFKGYIPQKFVSKGKWKDKKKFIKKVTKIEKELLNKGDGYKYKQFRGRPPSRKELLNKGYCKYKQFRGRSPSRIELNHDVGNGIEFYDKGICWPEDYVSHYIDNYNVMPTKKFYNYIINYKLKSKDSIKTTTRRRLLTHRTRLPPSSPPPAAHLNQKREYEKK